MGINPATGELQGRAIRPFSVGSHESSPRSGDHYLGAEEFDVKVHGATLATNKIKGAFEFLFATDEDSFKYREGLIFFHLEAENQTTSGNDS